MQFQLSTRAAVGRNDPCPCGSGRKFKNCCMGKAPAPMATPAPSADLQRVRELRDGGRFVEAARLARQYVGRRESDAAGHAALGLVYLHQGQAAEAAPSLWRAVQLAPDVASHHYDIGIALEQLGRDAEAIAAYQKSLALEPDQINAIERLGNLLFLYNRRKEAFDCFRRVAALEPDSLQGRINRGKVLIAEEAAGAEAYLRETARLFPESAEAQRHLSTVLGERGRFAEAIPLLERATEGTPSQAAVAYFELAMQKRITEADAAMLEQVHALLDYRPLQEIGRIRVNYGLGKAYDDLGDYARAMRHFDAANQLAAKRYKFDRAQHGAGALRIIGATTKAFFAQHEHLGSPSELPVLIVGMPRSGTTLVEQIVSSHPEVAGAGELPFWFEVAEDITRRGADGLSPERITAIAAECEANLRRFSATARRITDKLPGNFMWLGLFHLIFPRGRIIHCRRHPLDTCLSNYFTNFMAPMPYTYDKGHLAFFYRWYRRLMQHWREVLPEGTILDVDYEELVADPETATRRMIEFLGVPWNDACLRPEANPHAVRTASMWQARQPVYRSSTERWRNYEPWLGELRDLLEDDDFSDRTQPQSDNAKIPAATRLREAGRYDEAISALQQGLRADPNDPVMYCDAGSVCLLSNRIPLAVDCFERAIGLSPNFAVAHYNLGAALEAQGRTDEAMTALRRAIDLAPDMGRAYSRLGNLLQASGKTDEAAECFRHASQLHDEATEREVEEAKLLLGEGRAAEAEPLLRHAIEVGPANSLTHAVLGTLLAESGRLDEGTAMLRRAIELDPERCSVWQNLTMLTKITDAERPMIERMEELLAAPGRSNLDRSLLHFALGKAHDDLREYNRAIEHYDLGNRLEHARQPFDRQALADGVDWIVSTFTREYIERHRTVGAASDLPVLIVGMPRSGTTLTEQIVSAHPRVGGGGELTYWSERAAEATRSPVTDDVVARLARDYVELLRKIAPEAQRVTDKHPFNFDRLGLIHLALPGARFIHCRRDPIDTCLSIYFTRFGVPQPFAYDRGDLVFYYWQYQRLMAHWRSVLPADRLLEVDYEALTAKPEEETRRLIAFCGLAWDDACLMPERNRGVVRTASVWQARQPVYRSSVERWRNYEPWLGELAELRREGE